MMSIRLPQILNSKQMLRGSSRTIPKGCVTVYVGEVEKRRYVIPVWYLNQPSFRELLSQAEEEFGFNHPSGGLTIPCQEDVFADLVNRLNGSK